MRRLVLPKRLIAWLYQSQSEYNIPAADILVGRLRTVHCKCRQSTATTAVARPYFRHQYRISAHLKALSSKVILSAIVMTMKPSLRVVPALWLRQSQHSLMLWISECIRVRRDTQVCMETRQTVGTTWTGETPIRISIIIFWRLRGLSVYATGILTTRWHESWTKECTISRLRFDVIGRAGRCGLTLS